MEKKNNSDVAAVIVIEKSNEVLYKGVRKRSQKRIELRLQTSPTRYIFGLVLSNI